VLPGISAVGEGANGVNIPSEQILGAFSVFSYRRKIVYVDMRQNIAGSKPKIYCSLPFTSNPLAQAPSTENLYRTQIKPEGWED